MVSALIGASSFSFLSFFNLQRHMLAITFCG